MINSLSSLKMILPVFAVSTGISMFILLCSLLSLATVNPEKSSHRSGMLYGPDPDSTSGYERLIRKECIKHVWFLSAGGILSMLLMAAAAVFHRKIIAAAGTEIFILLCVFLCGSAVCCLLLKNGWKSTACAELVSFAELFSAAAHDKHAGIRMMLNCTETDIPFMKVLAAIQDDNPGISGTDLMRKAGSALGSEDIITAFSRNGLKKEQDGSCRYLTAYGTALSVLSFVILNGLCFLL